MIRDKRTRIRIRTLVRFASGRGRGGECRGFVYWSSGLVGSGSGLVLRAGFVWVSGIEVREDWGV